METQFGKVFFGSLAGYVTAPKYGLTEMELLDVMSCNKQVYNRLYACLYNICLSGLLVVCLSV